MTIEELNALRPGDLVHHTSRKNADGTPMRAKVTGIKRWKKSPRVEVHVKHGLRDYAVFIDGEILSYLAIPGKDQK